MTYEEQTQKINEDPKVASTFALWQEARNMIPGEARRVAVEVTKAAWQREVSRVLDEVQGHA